MRLPQIGGGKPQIFSTFAVKQQSKFWPKILLSLREYPVLIFLGLWATQ